MDHACPFAFIECVSGESLVSPSWAHPLFLAYALPEPFLPPSFTAVDLRPPQMAQSAKLWLIHHIKYLFHSVEIIQMTSRSHSE